MKSKMNTTSVTRYTVPDIDYTDGPSDTGTGNGNGGDESIDPIA